MREIFVSIHGTKELVSSVIHNTCIPLFRLLPKLRYIARKSSLSAEAGSVRFMYFFGIYGFVGLMVFFFGQVQRNEKKEKKGEFLFKYYSATTVGCTVTLDSFELDLDLKKLCCLHVHKLLSFPHVLFSFHHVTTKDWSVFIF